MVQGGADAMDGGDDDGWMRESTKRTSTPTPQRPQRIFISSSSYQPQSTQVYTQFAMFLTILFPLLDPL